MRTPVVRSAVECDLQLHTEKLTANVKREMVNHGDPSSRRVKLTAPESARRARCTPMPLGSRSTPISGAAAESSAISTLARAETAGLTLRCAENGGWHAPLRFDLRRPRVVAKRNPCLLLALIPDQLSNDTRAPVLKSPFHGRRGEYLWKTSPTEREMRTRCSQARIESTELVM